VGGFCGLAGEADGVGFPLLVKAVAGGGGKGMKIAFKKVSGRPAAAFQQPSCC
jgi:acetyl/propionyl-CoA carboxylase alpha subunit